MRTQTNNMTQTETTNLHYIPAPVRYGKRSCDLLIAGLALLLLLPLFPVIMLAVRLDSPGPLIFRQLRVGLATPDHTELFYMLKFRTMRVDAEQQTGPVLAQENDPRITRVGRFLRKTRLDELPQLINVLRGEMSLIGPRPERPGFYQRLENAIPWFAERTWGLRPGITGLAQVNQGYDRNIEDVRNKVGYDHAYALQLSRAGSWLLADTHIALRTVVVMVCGRGQ
ncbi:MAG: sugar transferase [Marinobacterium sp.]|nr:sugar transferase [Marinobacterium sp.]